MQSLAQYVEYLSQKNVAMKVHHASPTPAHELSDNLRMKFIPKSATTQPSMSIEEAMQAKGDYEYVFITDFLPSDPVKKHRLVESLITIGLLFLAILLVYVPGGHYCVYVCRTLHVWPPICVHMHSHTHLSHPPTHAHTHTHTNTHTHINTILYSVVSFIAPLCSPLLSPSPCSFPCLP